MIENLIEPQRLLLTWQPSTRGTRYLVGEIKRLDNDRVLFHYLRDTPDYNKALENGFEGYPAFRLSQSFHDQNVLTSFFRRLPPRSRGDFDRYLSQYLLPTPFKGSDLSLLAHTGAKLPSDTFVLLPDLSTCEGNFEYVLEVAGTRYQKELDIDAVQAGDAARLQEELDNDHDSNAIAVMHRGVRIGYVNKVLCEYLKPKVRSGSVLATIARKNGSSDRPLIYLIISIKN
tara:strand:+ start:329 stop:1018 length:690 start_codon:yes stop_codon:yes gene_type:complete